MHEVKGTDGNQRSRTAAIPCCLVRGAVLDTMRSLALWAVPGRALGRAEVHGTMSSTSGKKNRHRFEMHLFFLFGWIITGNRSVLVWLRWGEGERNCSRRQFAGE